MSADTEVHQPPEKRKRGRPPGSKTKNRLRDPARPASRRPRHYNRTQAAFELGMEYETLLRREKEHPVFAPAYSEGRRVIYTGDQLDIISLVMRGRLTKDQGLELWRNTDDAGLWEVKMRSRGKSE